MRKFGLIGYPLSHSFSKKYFSQKFENEGITDAIYDLYELKDLAEFPDILKNNPELMGLNVTIPYKESIIHYLDGLALSAQEVGAVNVIKITKNGKKIGHNSDYEGFLQTLNNFLEVNEKTKKANN